MAADNLGVAQKVVNVLNIIVLVGLTVCIILSGVKMRDGHDTALLLANTKELAQELRQSSDDLTRFIRTYTVTGNYSYWTYFLEVIAIRDGKAPLPKEPWRNHWDLYISDGKAPRGYDDPSALIPRMKAANFDDTEMELLEEAKRQSDALIDLENVAYHAMQGLYRPTNVLGLTAEEAKNFSVVAAPNATYARELVHSTDYHVWKGKIMRPLDDFAAHANERVLDIINLHFRITLAIVTVLAVMLACLMGLLMILQWMRNVQSKILQEAHDDIEAELTRIKAFLPPAMLAAFEQQDDEDDEEELHVSGLSSPEGILTPKSISSHPINSPNSLSSNPSGVMATESSNNSLTTGSGSNSLQRQHHHRKRGSGNHLATTAALNTDNTVMSKGLSVMSFNLVKFHQKVFSKKIGGNSDTRTFLDMQRSFLDIVQKCTKDQRGVIDFFQGDHIVVTFNAVTKATAPAKRAAVVALNVAALVKEHPQLPPVAIGFSNGTAMVGNTGTADMSRFNVVGTVYSRAMALQAMATESIKAAMATEEQKPFSRPSSRIFTCRDATTEFEHELYWQAVDFAKALPGREKFGSVIASVEQFKNMEQNEWMYMLEDGDKEDPFAHVNAAYNLFAEAKYREARAKAATLGSNFLGVKRLHELLHEAQGEQQQQ